MPLASITMRGIDSTRWASFETGSLHTVLAVWPCTAHPTGARSDLGPGSSSASPRGSHCSGRTSPWPAWTSASSRYPAERSTPWIEAWHYLRCPCTPPRTQFPPPGTMDPLRRYESNPTPCTNPRHVLWWPTSIEHRISCQWGASRTEFRPFPSSCTRTRHFGVPSTTAAESM